MSEVSRHLGFGLTWALSTLLFLWLGTVVDGWLATRPLFTLVGAFVGAGAGFYSMYFHLVIAPRRRARGEGAEMRSRGAGE
jgi:F0F1-type ATP synthase assembly protein I